MFNSPLIKGETVMKKLFAQIAIVVSFLCFSNAFAQQVEYTIDENGQYLGQLVINYKPTGYEVGEGKDKLSVEFTNGQATVTIGKLNFTMPIDGNYYHNRVGQWRTTPVITSFGDVGVTKMFYAGLTPYGRLYREELWLNGQIFNRSETVIDHNDQIVWSVATSSKRSLRLARI